MTRIPLTESRLSKAGITLTPDEIKQILDDTKKADKYSEFTLTPMGKYVRKLEQENKQLKEEKLREIEIGVEWFKMYESNKEIVQKVRERLPELIKDEKLMSDVGESTDDLRSEIQFYKEILGDKE